MTPADKPVPFSRSPAVLAYIKSHFSLTPQGYVRRDGKPPKIGAGTNLDQRQVFIGTIEGKQVSWPLGRLRRFLTGAEAAEKRGGASFPRTLPQEDPDHL